MNPLNEFARQQTRRQFFSSAGLRAGSIALASLMPRFAARASASGSAVHPALPGFPHFAPRAKNLIYLHMNGGPAQLDTWDYKPELQKEFDKDLPESIRQGQRLSENRVSALEAVDQDHENREQRDDRV